MAKTVSFAAVHFCVAFSVGYLITGDVMIGGALAMVEPAVNTVAYYFHEKVWNRSEKTSPKTADTAFNPLKALNQLRALNPLKALNA
ncbi:DUF2061 domain-containing protein [Endozoicomonas sp. ALC013]|uniref:DUF2061 domain-containing protein n=1 Tax=Endozoicomonas sp. ALC013 TaxID=3403076 RepID=UPI003BB81655